MTLSDPGDIRRNTRDDMRDDRKDANLLWGALLPTYRNAAAARVRDLGPLIDALSNARAVELVAARLQRANDAVRGAA